MRKRNENKHVTFDPLNIEDVEEEDCKDKSKIYTIHSISPFIAAAFITSLFGLYGLIYLIDGVYPTPLKLEDEQKHPNAFISERARNYLEFLTNIGPRVVGSYENEMLAVDVLKREVENIKQRKHNSKNIEVDLQTVSGSYYLDYKPHGAINSYGNVQNFIVKLSSSNSSDYSILVNAHFDSVPTSPGGSDDGINCAAMLEILNKLSKSSENFRHNIIFLFNGAEESPLQAAHGFITQHKWATGSKVVINLEAAGAGGKINLFQTGPGNSWLVKYYGRIPHPVGQVAGEEIFQSNLIPSDTDFRVFRDFGELVGYDMAFIRNGYRYHTKYDALDNIPLGSFQHVGDNVLYLLKVLANASEIENIDPEDESKAVYFDFLGYFMIRYSATVGCILNYLTVILCVLLSLKCFHSFRLGFDKESFILVGLKTGGIVGGWLLSAAFIGLIAFIIDAVGYSMSWYRNPWIVLGLYVVPVICISCGAILLADKYSKKNNISLAAQTQIQLSCVRLLWCAPLLVGTILGIRATHVLLLFLLFNIIAFGIVYFCKLEHTVRTWQVLHILSSLIPLVYLMQEGLTLLTFFIPICGRFGSHRNPEMVVGTLTLLITVIISTFYTPLITLVRKPLYVLYGLIAVFIVFFIIVFTPLGFPYSGNPVSPAPQRFWIQHTSRIFYDLQGNIRKKDAGFFLLNFDRNSPNSVRKYVKDIKKAEPLEKQCGSELFCALPVIHPRALQILNESTWIPAEQPVIEEPTDLKLEGKENLLSTLIALNFSVTGPSHMTVILAMQKKVSLKRINLTHEMEEGPIWNGRSTVFITYSWGKRKTPLNFSIILRVPDEWEGALLDVAVLGRYVHDKKNKKTPHFREFLNEFPEWADVVAWLGSYKVWSF